MKRIKYIVAFSLVCTAILQSNFTFAETNPDSIANQTNSVTAGYDIDLESTSDNLSSLNHTNKGINHARSILSDITKRAKNSNDSSILSVFYNLRSTPTNPEEAFQYQAENNGVPYTMSVLYETRSSTPVTSFHGAWSTDGYSYKDGNIFWAKVGSLIGVGLSSYLPRSSGLYPNYAQIDLWDGTTSRILTSDYNGSTLSYRGDDNFASEFTLDSATAEWHNDTLYDWNSLNARFYIIPKVHGRSYELWSRTARGQNVGSWLNSGVTIKTDGVGPKTTYLNDQPYTWISASSYDLKTSVVDEDSGAHRQRYFTTGAQPSGDWKEGTLNMTITITEQGRTGVSILGIDKLGNTTQNNTYVLLDNIKPTISVSGNPTSLCSSATLVVKASDNTNGGGIAYVVLPDGTKKTMEPETFNSSINYTVDRNGTYTFEVYDQAGNKATQTVNVTNIADTVLIPDPNLRAGIEKILGKASGAEIFKSELATIRDIVLQNKGIINLEGLQYCTNLRYLNLANNKIENVSPISNLPNLELVYLPDNLLTDSAVDKLKSLTGVTDLVLNGNKLTKVPDFVYSYKKLAHLNLDNNNISGAIPSNLGNISTLVDLRLSQNNFTGSIPTSFGNLKNLKCLWLSFNKLSGSIPKELANMTSLVDLMLHNNSLTGTIPAELSNAPNLKVLSFKNNKLYGEIPSSIGSMNLEKTTGNRYSGIYYTDFSNNLLIGDVPSTLLSKIDKDKFDKNLIRNGTTNQKQLILDGETSTNLGLEETLDINTFKKNVKIKNSVDSTVTYEELPSVYELVDVNRDSNYLDSNFKALKAGTTNLKFGIKNYYNNNTYATTSNQLAITILNPDVYLDVGSFANYGYADPNEANTYWVKVGNSFNFDVKSFTLKSSNVYPSINRINLQNGSINRRVDSNSNADSNFTSHFTLNKIVNQKTQTTNHNFLTSNFTITPNVHGETYEGLFTGGYSSSLPSEKSINQKIKTDGQGPTSGSPTTTSGRGSFSVSVPNITDNNQSGLKEVKFTVYQTANPSDKIDITEPFTTEGGTLNVTFNNSKLGSIYNSNNTEYTIEIRLYDNVGNSTYQAKRTATILPNLEIFDGAAFPLDKDNYPNSTDGLHPYKVSDSLYWVRTGAPFKIYREISMPGYSNTFPDTTYIQLRDSTNNNTISHKTSNFTGAYKNFTPIAHNDGTTSNFVMGSNSSDKLTLSSGGYYFNISTFEITALKDNVTYNLFTKAALDGSIETQFKDRQLQVKTDGKAPTSGTPTFTAGKGSFNISIPNISDNNQSGLKEVKFTIYQTNNPDKKVDIIQAFTTEGGTLNAKFDSSNLGDAYSAGNKKYTVEIRLYDNVGNESNKTTLNITVTADAEPENIHIFVLDRDKYPTYTDGYHPYKEGDTYWVRKDGDFSVYIESSLHPNLGDLYPDTNKVIFSKDNSTSDISITSSGVQTDGSFSSNFKFKSDFIDNSLSITNGFRFWTGISSGSNYRYSMSNARIEALIDGASYKILGSAGYDGNFAPTVDSNLVLKVDGGKPVISGAVDKDWSSTSIPISISATDSQSGMRSLELFDNATGTKLASGITSLSYTNSQTGVREFKVVATDQVGNIETKYFTHKIDTTNPVITFTLTPDVGTNWTNKDVTVSIKVSDSQSGIRNWTVKQNVDGGAWTNLADKTSSVSLNTSGIHKIEVTATDLAGNSVTSSITVKIDKILPVISGADDKDWSSTPIPINISATDSPSGMQKLELFDNTTGTKLASGTTSLAYTNSQTGVREFKVVATDNAGNVVTKYFTHKIDTTNPVITFTLNPDVGTDWTNKDVTVSISVSDSPSGVRNWTVKQNVDGGVWTNLPDKTSSVLLNSTGIHKIEVTATDLAGNSTTSSITVKIDKILPEIHSIPANNSEYIDFTTLTINATDKGGSLMKKLSLYQNNSLLSEGVDTISYFENRNGTHTYQLTAEDNAGNITTQEFTITILPDDINLIATAKPSNNLIRLDWNHQILSNKSYSVFQKRSDQSSFSLVPGTGDAFTNRYLDNTYASDISAPNAPSAKYTSETDTHIKFTISPSVDIGTEYDFYVVSKDTHGKLTQSNTATETITTGLKGYTFVVDGNPSTIPDSNINTTDSSLVLDTPILGGFPHYLHIAAIDNAGNMSPVSHILLWEGVEDNWFNQEVAKQTGKNLEDIRISDYRNLEVLTLRNKGISGPIPKDITKAINILEVDLYKNSITDVSNLANLPKLEYLQLGNNNISDISMLTNLDSLTDLNIFNNQVSDISIVSKMTNLERLYLHKNNITDISAIKNLNNLQELYIELNYIDVDDPETAALLDRFENNGCYVVRLPQNIVKSNLELIELKLGSSFTPTITLGLSDDMIEIYDRQSILKPIEYKLTSSNQDVITVNGDKLNAIGIGESIITISHYKYRNINTQSFIVRVTNDDIQTELPNSNDEMLSVDITTDNTSPNSEKTDINNSSDLEILENNLSSNYSNDENIDSTE